MKRRPLVLRCPGLKLRSKTLGRGNRNHELSQQEHLEMPVPRQKGPYECIQGSDLLNGSETWIMSCTLKSFDTFCNRSLHWTIDYSWRTIWPTNGCAMRLAQDLLLSQSMITNSVYSATRLISHTMILPTRLFLHKTTIDGGSLCDNLRSCDLGTSIKLVMKSLRWARHLPGGFAYICRYVWMYVCLNVRGLGVEQVNERGFCSSVYRGSWMWNPMRDPCPGGRRQSGDEWDRHLSLSLSAPFSVYVCIWCLTRCLCMQIKAHEWGVRWVFVTSMTSVCDFICLFV